MENELELSYETLTRVYLGSYEHCKGVVAEVEASMIKNGGNGWFRVVFPLVRLVSCSRGFKSSKHHFLNFFNDPRIIREQRIAAYKGYRGGGIEGDEEKLDDEYEGLWRLGKQGGRFLGVFGCHG
ncbi:hypothetical protein Tco_0461677 [Tanacetum coccineum]